MLQSLWWYFNGYFPHKTHITSTVDNKMHIFSTTSGKIEHATQVESVAVIIANTSDRSKTIHLTYHSRICTKNSIPLAVKHTHTCPTL